MPPSLVSPYTPRVGTQTLLTDLHYRRKPVFLLLRYTLSGHSNQLLMLFFPVARAPTASPVPHPQNSSSPFSRYQICLNQPSRISPRTGRDNHMTSLFALTFILL